MSAESIVLTALGAGVAGWAVENAFAPPRYSAFLPHTPILPAYAAGGATIAILTPMLVGKPLWLRFLVFSGALSAIESGAEHLERIEAGRSWERTGQPFDLPHAVAWGVVGTITQMILAKAEGLT